jgi:hypothetical protein
MDGASSDDLWIVGSQRYGPHNAASIGIAVHWDGKQWTKYDTPPSPNEISVLNRVLVFSSQDAWAVGSVVLHWDGNQWQSVAGPDTASNANAQYEDLFALSSSDMWVVGVDVGGGSGGVNGIVGHWDGTNWTPVPTPALDSRQATDFSGIGGSGSGDLWMVGYHGQDALFVHWDGANWTAIPNPIAGFSSSFTSVVAVGSELWAAGTRVLDSSDYSGQGSAVVMRYTSQPCPASAPQKPLNPPVPLPGQGSQQFITGQTASGIFLSYWQQHGGLLQQGYPISGVFGEQSELDGHIYTVQYFERGLFEYHPENKGTPYEVLLAQLGTFQYHQKYSNGAPNQRANHDAGTVFFPQTGKHLGGTFLQYWQEHGGLLQQGYPISEEFTEVSDLDGRPYTVQYFERAVFEWHPENPAPYNVLLSQLGHFRYEAIYGSQQGQTVAPRQIASSILPDTLRGAANRLVWADLRDNGYNSQMIYSYDASQNRELSISQAIAAPDSLPLATNGSLAFWTRRDTDRRYLEGYDFRSGAEARLYQPDSVTSPDFRRSDIALDQTTLYYTDNWTGHTGIFAQDLVTGASSERQIYGNVPIAGSLVAADGALLWTEQQTNGPNTTRTLRLYQADTGSVTTLASGIGGFTGYSVSGDYVVYSFYSNITNQTTYLYNIRTSERKVIALGAASDPVILGNRVAWVRWPSIDSGESDGWKIETYDISSGTTKAVASGLRAMPRNLVLLADGKIAFAADNDLSVPGSELYILDLDSAP